MLFLLACSDYSVEHSKLVDEAETGDIDLTDGESAEVRFTCSADREALDASPGTWLGLTVFSVQEGGSPRVYVEAGSEAADAGVVGPTYLDVTVTDLFAGCDEGDTFDATWDGDTCTVSVPVGLSVVGGVVTGQIEGHLQLDFGSAKPPGEAELTVE